jgi:hypothetical protein
MRFPLAIAACVGLALGSLAVSPPVQAQDAPAGRMLDLRDDSALQSDSGLRILRGSAAPPRAVAPPSTDSVLGAGRYQAVAGERFWMIDQETGKLVSCRNRGTANVGERKIACVFGTFSRYSRGFGNNFQH